MSIPSQRPSLTPIHRIQVPKGPRLSVTSLETAGLDHDSYDVVISLVDPGTVLEWSHPRHYLFFVEDCVDEVQGAPDAAFLQALLEIDLAAADRVLIHCHGGYSRSPAAAMLLAWRLGARIGAIEKGINWRRAYPNRRILELGEALLATGGTLMTLAVRKAQG